MRIVAGSLGGRRLIAPKDDATRPTSEKVREAIFASLGVISGARVLDLYAGTGGLGLEALSRGATSLVLVESRRAALVALHANVASLGVGERVVVIEKAVERARALLLPHAPFDLILADPPYALVDSGEVAKTLLDLLNAGLANEDATLVLEHSSKTEPPELGALAVDRTRRYGDTSVSFYEAR